MAIALVSGAEMQNGAIQQPCVAVENREGYLICRAPPLLWRSNESQLHTGLPSPGFQGQKEKFPQSLAVKSSEIAAE